MSALIAYRNLFDAWPFDIDGGPGTDNQPLAGYPLANLKLRQLSSVTRITNLDTGSGNPLFIPFAPVSAVTANVVVVYGYPPSQITFEGTLGSASVLNFSTDDSGIGLPPLRVFLIPSSIGDLERMTFEYGLVFPPNYIELARVYVANALVLPNGVDATWSLGVDDSGSLDASHGRQWYEAAGVRTRRLDISIAQMPTEVAFGFPEGATSAYPQPSIQDLQLQAGATGEIVVVPRSSNGLWIRRAAVYGHMERAPAIRHAAGPNFSTQFSVIEER